MIIFNANSTQAVIDGKTLILDSAPYFYNTFFMIPVRTVAERFGWSITWDLTKTTLKKGSDTIEIFVHSNRITKNGVVNYTNNNNRIIAGRTFVQANIILSLMGLQGIYSSVTKQFVVSIPEIVPPIVSRQPTIPPIAPRQPTVTPPTIPRPPTVDKIDYSLIGLLLIGYWLWIQGK